MAEPLLVLSDVRAGYGSAIVLDGVSLEMPANGSLAVLGRNGVGKSTLLLTIMGFTDVKRGAIAWRGRDITRSSVVARMKLGMAYMPADRAHTALVTSMTIGDNLMLRDTGRAPYGRGPLLTRASGTSKARELMADYDIRARDPKVIAARLSGGNQQKIVIARELDRSPAVLIAHQAAWGLDPGATRFVLERVMALRDGGAAVIYISSELEEVLAVSDRVAVIANGGFAGIVARAEVDLRQIGLWMAGSVA